VISIELRVLGFNPIYFGFTDTIPDYVDAVITFAPYGRLMPIARQLADYSEGEKPIDIHWSTENPLDL
jgi:hypothetical protein